MAIPAFFWKIAKMVLVTPCMVFFWSIMKLAISVCLYLFINCLRLRPCSHLTGQKDIARTPDQDISSCPCNYWWPPYSGPPRLAMPQRPGPCLDFRSQYALIRNNQSKKFGVEYRALSDSNSPWRPWLLDDKLATRNSYF